MARRIRISFPQSGVEAVATLLEDEAPATSDMVWQVLAEPLRGRVEHARGIGPEIYIMMPPAPEVPNENLTVFPIPGDLLFYHYDGQLPRGEVIYDIGIYYDRSGHSFWGRGWVAGNVFATVTGNLEGLQMVARAIATSGAQMAVIARLDE